MSRRLVRLTQDTLSDLPLEVRADVLWEVDPVRRHRLAVGPVEEAVAAHYATIQPAQGTVARLSKALMKAMELQTAGADAEAPQEDGAPAFARGDLVEVRRYGRGVVEEASATQVTVAFADRSRRSFLPEYVRRATARRRPAAAPERRAT